MSNKTVHISSTVNTLFLCRLCGTETISQDERINIFDTNGLALDLKAKIANCLGLIVNENDNLPKNLCAECVDNLEKFNEFKIKSNEVTLCLINIYKKQKISVGGNESTKQANRKQETSSSFDPDFQVKIEPNDELSNTNPNIQAQFPPSQYDMYSPVCILNEMEFQNDIGSDVFPNRDSKNNVHYTSNIKVNVKSNLKKSKSKRKTKSKYVKTVKEYTCAHCPKVINTRVKLYKHMKNHLEALINYNCTLCGMKLKTKSSLSKHIKRHNKQFEYVCSYCGKGMVGKTNYEVHIRTAHTKVYPFECTKCDKKFPSKNGLKNHEQTVHSDKYNFTCEICHKSFKIKSYLMIHYKNHDPVETRKKYKCTLCDATYVNNARLKYHMLGHTGELKFGCDQCDKSYKTKAGLTVHMLTHTGEKNHVCDVCGKAFMYNRYLVDHLRIHTGERPFKCNVCQKGFNQKSALRRHEKSCSQNK